jgi:hypothetical protein
VAAIQGWRLSSQPGWFAVARGVTYEQEWTLTLTAAHVHATLALAAATAVGTAGPDGHAWAHVAATRLSARKLETPSESSPGPTLYCGAPAPVSFRGQPAPLDR